MLAHLTHDLSQAEKKITVLTNWVTDKMTNIFAQNDNFDNFEWSCHYYWTACIHKSRNSLVLKNTNNKTLFTPFISQIFASMEVYKVLFCPAIETKKYRYW